MANWTLFLVLLMSFSLNRLSYSFLGQYILFNIGSSRDLDFYDIIKDVTGVRGSLNTRLILKPDITLSSCKFYKEGESTQLYCFSKRTLQIFKVDFNHSPGQRNASVEVLEEGISSSDTQIAVDNIHGQLYWSDKVLQRIQTRAISSDSEDSNATKTVIFYTGFVTALAVDETNRHLFWASTYITRSDLRGENKKVLVAYVKNAETVLFTDPVARVLYWLDDSRHTLEFIEYDGGNRGFVAGFYANNRMTFSNLGENEFLFTEGKYVYHLRLIESSDTKTQNISLIQQLPHNSNIIGVIKPHNPTLSAECKMKQCSQFCNDGMHGGVECGCMEGYSLHLDKRTCYSPVDYVGDGIFLGINKGVYMGGFKMFTGISGQLKPLSLVTNATIFQFIRRKMYYVFEDGIQHKILEFSLDSLIVHDKPVVVSSFPIRGLQCDTARNEIYWLAGDELHVLLVNSDEDKLLLRDTKHVSTIALDQRKRSIVMCSIYTSNIEIYDVASNTRTVVTQAINPQCGGIDIYTHRPIIEVCGGIISTERDGRDTKVIRKLQRGQTALAVFKEVLMYSGVPAEGGEPLFNVIHKEFYDFVFSSSIGINGSVNHIAVLDEASDQANNDKCTDDNGGCKQVCTFELGVKCTCFFGYELSGQICETAYIPKAFLVLSTSNNRLYQVEPDSLKTMAVKYETDERINDIAKNSQANIAYAINQDTGTIVTINLENQTNINISFNYFHPIKVAVHSLMGNLIIINQTYGTNVSILCSYSLSNQTFWRIFEGKSIEDVAIHEKQRVAFIITGNAVVKLDLRNGSKLEFINNGLHGSKKICVDEKANTVYIVDSLDSTSRLMRSGLRGELLTRIYHTSNDTITHISVDDTAIYFLTSSSNVLKRILKTALERIGSLPLSHMFGHIVAFIAPYKGTSD